MALSLTIPGGVVQLSGNPIWCNVTGAVVPAGATKYQVLLKITSIDGIVKGGPFVDAISPEAGAAVFDVSGYVDIPLPAMFEWPLVGAVGAYIDAAYNVSIQAGERYIDSEGDLQESYSGATENIQIIKGGISDLRMGEYNDAGTSFYTEMVSKYKFLTNQPDNMVVGPDQPLKLFMMPPQAGNLTMTLYVNGLYADGSEEMFTQEFSVFSDGLFEFNFAPYHIGLPLTNLAGSEMIRLGVAIVNAGDGSIGDSRTYWINNDHHENSNYLFAVNSYGCVDVIWLTGSVTITTDVSGSEGVRPLAQGASARTRTIIQTSRSGRKKYKINTGWKLEAEMAGLEDIYLSKQMWLLYKGKLIPVNLVNGDQLLADSMKDLHSAELELVEAHNRRFV